MKAGRLSSAAFAVATTIAMNGCLLCNADEEHAVTVASVDSLVVTRDGVPRRIEFVTRVGETEIDRSAFQFVFNTIEGSTSGEGVVLTLSGSGPAPNELVVLSLALPVSLRRGDEYPAGSTFTVEPGLSTDPGLWGPRDLQQPDRAEVAFTTATYSFPPPLYTTTFRAVTSMGTIRVTQRERGWVELSLNLTFTDAAGKTATVTGRAQANSESFTPPCT